jgi:hypothetical protein
LVLDVFTGLLIAIGAGAGLGALSALMGWAASNEAFEGRKFGIGIATGTIAGVGIIALSFPAIKAALAADGTGVAMIELMIPIAISIVGTDLIRAKISAMVANRQSNPTIK